MRALKYQVRAAGISFLILLFSYIPTKAQKEIEKGIPEDLKGSIVLVERIPLHILEAGLKDRDSASIAYEYYTIGYIQNLYLQKEPRFRNLIVNSGESDSVANTNLDKYRYILRYKIIDRKVNKVEQKVLAYYFYNAKERSNGDLLEEQHYNTKASLVQIYGRIGKMYVISKK